MSRMKDLAIDQQNAIREQSQAAWHRFQEFRAFRSRLGEIAHPDRVGVMNTVQISGADLLLLKRLVDVAWSLKGLIEQGLDEAAESTGITQESASTAREIA